MQLHPRTLKVQEASAKMGLAICKVAEEYGLTYVELMQCILAAGQMNTKFALRDERHPESPETPGDQA